jgi:RecA/RadA recombinase
VQQCHRISPEKKVFFFDVEGRLRSELLDCFPDINRENFNVVRSNDQKILTAEDYLNLIYETLKDYPSCICILDSVAALCPEAELSSNIGESVKMASTATLMYKMFRRVSQILSVTKATFIALTHMVANPNPGPGKKSFAVGGNAPQYGASVWMEAAWYSVDSSFLDSLDEDKKFQGQQNVVNFLKENESVYKEIDQYIRNISI